MKGLELSEVYYQEVCLLMLRERFPAQLGRIAVGLVGEGSECFGFDDELSQDHDFGPRVMLWLDPQYFDQFGFPLQAALNELPQAVAGYPAGNITPWGEARRGVFSIPGFYARFIGLDRPPSSNAEWRRIPETYLAVATNGKVFADPLGGFSAFRSALLNYYPEDVRLKKIAARCVKMAQAGQYNYPRCLKRNEPVAAWMAAAEFMDAAISLVFLLNRRYKPFYKWMHRAVGDLPTLGQSTQQLLTGLVARDGSDGTGCIEALCALVIEELKSEALTDSSSDFLLEHALSIQQRIQDPMLRGLDPLAE